MNQPTLGKITIPPETREALGLPAQKADDALSSLTLDEAQEKARQAMVAAVNGAAEKKLMSQLDDLMVAAGANKIEGIMAMLCMASVNGMQGADCEDPDEVTGWMMMMAEALSVAMESAIAYKRRAAEEAE